MPHAYLPTYLPTQLSTAEATHSLTSYYFRQKYFISTTTDVMTHYS